VATAQTPHVRPTGDMIGPLARIQPAPPNHLFPNGTTFVYGAEWRIWNAGTVTLRTETVAHEQHVTGTADAAGFVALLYTVRDRFEARFNSRTFCSSQIFKHTEEGLRKRDTQITFDYARRKSVLDETNLKTRQKKRAEEEIPGCVTDVLSAIYYVGSLPLQVGSTYIFPLNDGGKTADVRLTVEGREQIKTDAGTFSTLRVRPEASAGVLKDNVKVWLWYTDDAQRTPVQMRARMFWGTLTLKLQRVQKQ
jgi:hypothetical protein